MIFDLSIKANSDDLKFGSDSALVKFFVSDKNLKRVIEHFFETMNLSVNNLQKRFFIDEKNDELIYNNSAGEPALLFLKKIKLDKDFNTDFFRNYFAGLIPSLQNKSIKSVNVIVPVMEKFKEHFHSQELLLRSITEGIYLGNYSFDKYKSDSNKPEKLLFNIHFSNQNILRKELENTQKVLDAVFFTRDLVNEPAMILTPNELAVRAKSELDKLGVSTKIYDVKELKKRKMNAILSVGSASHNPPCMIVMNYKPKVKAKKKIALVGKGVTYDSGGLSIKPTSGMIDMKADMAGGALVIGVMKAAALLNLPVEIIGVVPAVENMLGGNAFKPGDVIISASGKSIEVKDTDAEGRLILADALHYATQQKPDQIIDFATLTGACVVALGEIAAGLFTENDVLAERLLKSGNTTYERLWRLPFWNDYKKMIKSEIADVANLGPRWGGAITAGKFLEHFVDEKIPWAHIDIAGPAVKHKSTNYTEKYDTGFGVRMMIDYLSNC